MRLFVCVFQYYEMSYGLNVEMHKQVSFCYQPRFFRIFSRLTKRLHNHFCVLKYDLLQDIYIPAAPAPAEGRGACSPTEKLPPPLGKCMGRPVTCPSYAYLVGTVVFDANKHEAN